MESKAHKNLIANSSDIIIHVISGMTDHVILTQVM